MRDTMYREEFLPVAGIGDYVALLGRAGLRGVTGKSPSGLYRVTGRTPFPASNKRNLVLFWIDPTTGNAVAGYDNDGSLNNAHINAGQEVQAQQLKTLQLGKNRIAQVRLRFKFVVQPTGVVHDFNFRIYDGQIPWWYLANAHPAYNLIQQLSDPADVTNAAAQGVNQGLPASFASAPPSHFNASTEKICVEDESLTIGITNDGAAVTALGACGVHIRGFVLNLEGVPSGPNKITLTSDAIVQAPAEVTRSDIVILQTSARDPGSSPS